MQQQRIAHIIWEMGIGGAERALYQLVMEQRNNGIAADLILGRTGGLYADMARETGATVHELGQYGALDMSVSGNFRNLLSGYDIVHFHSAEIGLIHLATKVTGPRLYYTHRSGVFRYSLRQLLRYRLTGGHLRGSFDGISGNTYQATLAAASLFDLPADSIPITYNGIDFTLLDPLSDSQSIRRELPDLPDGTLIVGTSAKLRPWKRVHMLIEAMAHLADLPIHCVIVGDGPLRPDLESQVSKLGLQGRVTIVGLKEHVGNYLQVMDIFALPSGPEESFGNSVVEGMGMGLPSVVFADGGGTVEHIEDGVSGFIANDIVGMSDRIRSLALDPELRKSIGRAGRSRVRERYALSGLVDRYNVLYANKRAGTKERLVLRRRGVIG